MDIARVKGLGREARFLRPYLLAALHAVPPAHPISAQCKAILADWDGSAFAARTGIEETREPPLACLLPQRLVDRRRPARRQLH